MRIGDLVLGTTIMLILAWVVVVTLNQGSMILTMRDFINEQSENKTLISPEEYCDYNPGYSLVLEPNTLDDYRIIAGKTPDKNQTYFCFYKTKEPA